MDSPRQLVEFVGIPYAWKTSTLTELQRQLRKKGIVTHAIHEFRGTESFYAERKLTPDVNLLRSLNFMQEFMQVARDGRTEVILVDRGLYDAICWIRWFETFQQIPSQFQRALESLLDTIPIFMSRYRIVWMDRDPLAALRSHGSQPGRIVNFKNLTALRGIYETQFGNLPAAATFHRVDSDSGSAHQIAESLLPALKLRPKRGSSRQPRLNERSE